MEEKENQEFTLEDILKEFGSNDVQPDPEETEKVLEEQPEEEEQLQDEQPSVVTEATIRLDKLPDAVVGTVRNAQHIDDEDDPIVPPVPEESTYLF